MSQQPFDVSKPQSKLQNIHKGMGVYDSKGDKVGTVEELYFGASSDELEEHGAGAATAPNPDMHEDTLMEDIARGLFEVDEPPEEMRKRLINEGFIRVDSTGLLARDRYVLPEQIDRVHNDHVHLNVPRDQLLKR